MELSFVRVCKNWGGAKVGKVSTQGWQKLMIVDNSTTFYVQDV